MNDSRLTLYLRLIGVFAPLSLLSFGGGQSIIADIHKQSVDVFHWVTQAQFVDLFAISRAAPGPGALFTTLIGWHVGGWMGALVASLSLFVPSSILAYAVARMWNRHGDKPWFSQVQRALIPLACGLILAGAYAVLSSSSGGVSIWAIALVAAALFMKFDKINPLPTLFVAGLVQALVRAWL